MLNGLGSRVARRSTATLMAAAALGGGVATTAATPAAMAAQSSRPPLSKATVLKVQHLFQVLGYPLGSAALGGFGPRTKGAVEYFQRKYSLPVTGYPDTATIARMEEVAATLRGPSGGGSQAAPRDIVENIFGGDVPFLTIAVALAATVALLANGAGRRRSQVSPPADEAMAGVSTDS